MGSGTRREVVWAALITVYLVWGSTYLAIRIVVETMPPLLSAGARFVTAGVLLALVLAVRSGWARLRVGARELASCAVVGGLLLLGGNGHVVIAEQHIDSGLAALVIAAVPLFVVLFRLMSGDKPRPATVAAVLLGFGGIAVLLSPGSGDTHLLGVATVLAAAFFWSVGSFSAASLPLPKDPFVTSVWEMVSGGVIILVTATARGEPWRTHLGDASLESWLWLGYLVVFGSLLAFTAYAWLLGNAPISFVATYAYVNPAVAVLLGSLVLDESITAPVLVGGAIVIASVAAVVSVEQRPRGAPPEPTAPSAEHVVLDEPAVELRRR